MGDDTALLSLPPDMLARLAPMLRPGDRLNGRDAALRLACRLRHASKPRTLAAKALAAEMVAGAPDDVAAACALNGGRALGWRQIASVLEGWRGW